MRSENSHHHLLLAVRVLWLHFQLLHIAVADLGPLPGALAFGPCERERRATSLLTGVSCPSAALGAHPEPPGLHDASRWALGFPRPAGKARDFRSTYRPRARHTAPGAAGAARPSGVSCWSEGRGAGVGTREGARPSVWRPGDAARPCSLRRSAPLFPAPLAPAAPVGGCLSAVAARCALRWAPRSLHSLPPPAPVSFKSAAALAASELINMQNHSVTH